MPQLYSIFLVFSEKSSNIAPAFDGKIKIKGPIAQLVRAPDS